MDQHMMCHKLFNELYIWGNVRELFNDDVRELNELNNG